MKKLMNGLYPKKINNWLNLTECSNQLIVILKYINRKKNLNGLIKYLD